MNNMYNIEKMRNPLTGKIDYHELADYIRKKYPELYRIFDTVQLCDDNDGVDGVYVVDDGVYLTDGAVKLEYINCDKRSGVAKRRSIAYSSITIIGATYAILLTNTGNIGLRVNINHLGDKYNQIMVDFKKVLDAKERMRR